jgi:hypothetical protein
MFTNESFSVISITEIPKDVLLEGVIKLLEGREMYVDTDCDLEEKVYSGDVFYHLAYEIDEMEIEAITCMMAEMENSPLLPPLEVIEQINNLAAIIKTELIRINTI